MKHKNSSPSFYTGLLFFGNIFSCFSYTAANRTGTNNVLSNSRKLIVNACQSLSPPDNRTSAEILLPDVLMHREERQNHQNVFPD